MQCYSSSIVFYLVIFTVYFTNSAVGLSTHNFMAQCGKSPDCLRDAIQSALPGFIRGNRELGIQPLDPFVVDKLELTLPGNLKLQFNEGYSKGLRKCIVDSARMVEDTLHAQFRCNLTIKGKYKSFGRLLVFTIDGDGDSFIKCRDIRVQCVVKLATTVGEDGLEHLQIVHFKADHSYDGQVIYRMTNLIKGNPHISNVILQFMNRNWRMVAEEFGKPIVDFGIESVLNNVMKFLKVVPLNTIFGMNG